MVKKRRDYKYSENTFYFMIKPGIAVNTLGCDLVIVTFGRVFLIKINQQREANNAFQHFLSSSSTSLCGARARASASGITKFKIGKLKFDHENGIE